MRVPPAKQSSESVLDALKTIANGDDRLSVPELAAKLPPIELAARFVAMARLARSVIADHK